MTDAKHEAPALGLIDTLNAASAKVAENPPRAAEIRANWTDGHETPSEPCFECGSTERIGTACKPCNPELNEAPAEGAGELIETWIKRALIYIDQCVGAGEIHFPGIEDDPADLAGKGFALFGLEDDCDAAAIPSASLRARSSAPEAREGEVVAVAWSVRTSCGEGGLGLRL